MSKILSCCWVKSVEECRCYVLFCIIWTPRCIVFIMHVHPYSCREYWWWGKDNASKSCCEWDRGNLHQCNICQPLSQILWRFWKDSKITIWNGKNLKYAHFPLTNNLWYMNFGWRRTRIDKNPYFQLCPVLYASISFHRPVVLFYNFIAINIILVDLLHVVTEKETATQYKRQAKKCRLVCVFAWLFLHL